jgi:zinc transporter ZupT
MNIVKTLAEAIKINPGEIGITAPVRDADNVLLNILNTAYLWAGIVCIIIIIIAGYFYVTSNGNAATIKRGKDAIMGAIIGIIVIILAFTITQFVIGRF